MFLFYHHCGLLQVKFSLIALKISFSFQKIETQASLFQDDQAIFLIRKRSFPLFSSLTSSSSDVFKSPTLQVSSLLTGISFDMDSLKQV